MNKIDFAKTLGMAALGLALGAGNALAQDCDAVAAAEEGKGGCEGR